VVPYLQPGSEQLADKVIYSMKGHNLAIMRNHGLVVVGETFDEVFQSATFFELACSIVVRAGNNISPIPCKDIKKLLRPAGKKSENNASV
jgi:ribulose-5-phosphate 4-epimerase/fuculose-1-phosphate aldolase